MKRLIVNADDLGVTRGVNRGIFRAFSEGIVTSATIQANGEAFDDAVQLSLADPKLGIGVHLTLVGGRAVGRREQIGALADKNGQLPATLAILFREWSRSRVRRQHIESEMRAQIERVRQAGIEPTHVDTHKHAHIHPWVMKALARVASDCGITKVRMPYEDIGSFFRRTAGNGPVSLRRRLLVLGARVNYPAFRYYTRKYGLQSPGHFFGFAVTGQLGREGILHILRNMPQGTSELVCHPGICDADLQRQGTRLLEQRQQELEALRDPEVRREISTQGAQLISFRELD